MLLESVYFSKIIIANLSNSKNTKAKITGWMHERFCFSLDLIVDKYLDGTPASTLFALMPWASASVLEGLLDYKDIDK